MKLKLSENTCNCVCGCNDSLGLWRVWVKVWVKWKKGTWSCQFSMGDVGIANIACAKRPTWVRDLGWILWRRWWPVMVPQRFSTMDGKPIFHFLNTSIFAEYTVVDSACVVKIHIDGDGDLNPYIKIKDLPYSVVAYLRVRNLVSTSII